MQYILILFEYRGNRITLKSFHLFFPQHFLCELSSIQNPFINLNISVIIHLQIAPGVFLFEIFSILFLLNVDREKVQEKRHGIQ